MRRLTLLAIALSLLLPACSPSAGAVETAIAQTQAARPTSSPVPTVRPTATATKASTATPTPVPTATQIPLADIDLESLLIQSGDLPAGYSGGQVRSGAPAMFDELPPAIADISQQFEHNGGPAGGVTIFLYSTVALVRSGYQAILAGFGDDTVARVTVGEQARMVETGFGFDGADIVFTRCAAVVHVRMTDGADAASVTAYAERLDDRLQPVVCR